MSQDLETRLENAMIAWLANAANHGQTLPIAAKRYESPKFDPDTGDLLSVEMPRITVRATTQRQLHYQTAVYLVNMTVVYEAISDDTPTATWDDVSGKIETILWNDALEENLTNATGLVRVYGIPSRMPHGKQTLDRHWSQTFDLTLWASRRAGT